MPGTAGRHAWTRCAADEESTLRTYKTRLENKGRLRIMPEFDTKIAVLLRDDLATWQRLNMTAFLVSGVAGTTPELLGEEYLDADDTRYLPMFRQPVLV